MTKLLLKLFIRNDYTVSTKGRESVGKLAGAVGIFCNLLLSTFKLLAGYLTKSIAISADAVNNLSDAASSVVTLLGFRLSGKPADRDHPYGHARYEYVAGLIVSFLIMMVGLMLAKSSVMKILHPEKTVFSYTSVIILTASVFVKLWMAFFNRKLGKLIHSEALIAVSADSRNDVIATTAVLLSTFFSYFTGYEIDGIFGALVSLFILYSGFGLVQKTISPLLGQVPSEETYRQIRDKILSHEKVLGIHDLMVHSYGHGACFASVHIEVDAREDIMTSHDLLDEIERQFHEQDNIHLVAHLDPTVIDDPVLSVLKERIEQIVGEFDPELSIHDFRAVFGSDYKNIIFDLVVPPEYKFRDEEIAEVIRRLIPEKLDEKIYVVPTVDHGYGIH